MDIRAFRGLNNVSDPLRVGPGWLATASNVDVTDSGGVKKREGYSLAQPGAYSGCYTTIDYQRMYVSDGGSLKSFDGTSFRTLKTGLSTATMYWTEVNNQVYYNNGVDSGVVLADDQVIDWAWPTPSAPTLAATTGTLAPGQYVVAITYSLADGRMTGDSDHVSITLGEGQALQLSNIPQLSGYKTNVFIAPANSTVFQYAGSPTTTAWVWNRSPDYLGFELQTEFFDHLPLGCSVVQEWKGRIYAAQYIPNEDLSVVWFTEPLAFHLFNLNSGFLMVPGKVNLLAKHESALIVGTETRIYAYDGKELAELAPYGSVAGQHWSLDDDGSIIFWTKRGVCRALPFKNLTEQSVSVAPGASAGGTIVRRGGQKHYVVTLRQGGSAFNSYL